jgi:hypothetical protein
MSNNHPAKDLDEFIGWIVGRYMQRSTVISRSDADQFARANFEKYGMHDGVAFGDPDYGWTVSDAYDLADDDMANWEA